MKEMHELLENLFKNEMKIVVGVSGGPDSMFLLHVLQTFQKQYNLELIVAHVNHNLRTESENEYQFVQTYCEENNLKLEYLKINNYENGKFSEKEARDKRYAFFQKVIEKYNADVLMTAHHGDDLIESILMKIVRGTNFIGYSGIPSIKKCDNYLVVRPLLTLTKAEILEYLSGKNKTFVYDKSNESDKYTRNRYRKQVLPFLKNEDCHVHKKFLKFSEDIIKADLLLKELLLDKIKDVYDGKRVDLKKLRELSTIMQERIIADIIKEIQKNAELDIKKETFKNILQLIQKGGNKEIDLANNFVARTSYDYLYIEKKKSPSEYNLLLEDIIIKEEFVIKKISDSNKTNNFITRLNSKELKLPLYVRTKKDGDIMEIKNLNGKKKLKDIFIDSKIDITRRGEYPIVVDSNNTVIWVPGIKKSKFDKEISEKYDIILEYIGGENEYFE